MIGKPKGPIKVLQHSLKSPELPESRRMWPDGKPLHEIPPLLHEIPETDMPEGQSGAL
jgi:hypothetical protein